jgi:hypothetical protein
MQQPQNHSFASQSHASSHSTQQTSTQMSGGINYNNLSMNTSSFRLQKDEEAKEKSEHSNDEESLNNLSSIHFLEEDTSELNFNDRDNEDGAKSASRTLNANANFKDATRGNRQRRNFQKNS